MIKGFRRSGAEIYRPHCPGCQSCHSIRINAKNFRPSRSQKRVQAKAQRFRISHSYSPEPGTYELYERYINTRHRDGSMYPATKEQYDNFLFCHWLNTLFLNVWDEDKLIAVAVTDILPTTLSAIYTFYDPDYENYSLGTYCILNQIALCSSIEKDYLYLGYQIEGCDKMNYKTKYRPFERLEHGHWYQSQ